MQSSQVPGGWGLPGCPAPREARRRAARPQPPAQHPLCFPSGRCSRGRPAPGREGGRLQSERRSGGWFPGILEAAPYVWGQAVIAPGHTAGPARENTRGDQRAPRTGLRCSPLPRGTLAVCRRALSCKATGDSVPGVSLATPHPRFQARGKAGVPPKSRRWHSWGPGRSRWVRDRRGSRGGRVSRSL